MWLYGEDAEDEQAVVARLAREGTAGRPVIREETTGWTPGLLHELLTMGRKRGISVDVSHLTPASGDEDYPYLSPGDPSGRLDSETLHDQLVRETTPQGRRLSQQIAWARQQRTWGEQAIEQAYGISARRIRREVNQMASGVDADQVMARVRRMGVPDKIQSLIMSLPVSVLAAQLMADDPTEKRFPVEPPEYSVLMWEKSYPGSSTVYHYVAVRAGDQWWLTGRPDRNPSPISWPELDKLIGNSPCRIATQWGDIPVIEKPQGLNPAEWFEKVIKNRNAVDARDDEGSDS